MFSVAAMASLESIYSGIPDLSSGVNARAYFSRAVYFRLVLVFLSFPYLVDEKAPVNSVSNLLGVALPFEHEREGRRQGSVLGSWLSMPRSRRNSNFLRSHKSVLHWKYLDSPKYPVCMVKWFSRSKRPLTWYSMFYRILPGPSRNHAPCIMRVMQLYAAVKISVMLIQDSCVTLDPNRSAVNQQEV